MKPLVPGAVQSPTARAQAHERRQRAGAPELAISSRPCVDRRASLVGSHVYLDLDLSFEHKNGAPTLWELRISRRTG